MSRGSGKTKKKWRQKLRFAKKTFVYEPKKKTERKKRAPSETKKKMYTKIPSMPAQSERPGVKTTQIGNQAVIERHELSMLSRQALVDLFRSIEKVVCYKDFEEDGKTTQVGIPPHYMKEKFDYLLAHNLKYGDLEYGEEGGVKRTATFVYVYKNAKITRRGDIFPSGEPIAFALVCSPGPIFHRLRPHYVENSVYLAMLCGNNATMLYHEVLRDARAKDKVVTLDSLKHVITYYLRPEFGTAVAIDTEVAFELSRDTQEYFVECERNREKPDKQTLRKYRDKIIREIAPGELFVPVSESSHRGHRGEKREREGYMQAHIVVFDSDTENVVFDDICMPDSSARVTMDQYDNPPRNKRRLAENHSPKTKGKKPRRVQFGANIGEEPFAVNKHNEKLTIDMEKINGLAQNGDYRLVHSNAKATPSAGLTFAKDTIRRFRENVRFYDSSMDQEDGAVQRALAVLYKKDKKNLRFLINGLIEYEAEQRA